MSLAQRELRQFTSEEYLAIERTASYRSEFWHGKIYAMAGASSAHNRILPCLAAAVVPQLRGTGCAAVSNDMKVRTSPEGLFAYPDLSVVCGAERYHDTKRDVLLNPITILEILSPLTAAMDRNEKFLAYQELESLRDYILIAQDKAQIEHYARQEGGRWVYQTVTGLDASLTLSAVPVTLSLAEIYESVVFPPTLFSAEAQPSCAVSAMPLVEDEA